MSRRIRRILLVCNTYDGYSLEEDGRLESHINQEYGELNLSNPPTITRARSTREALEIMACQESFDLVITMLNVGELSVFEFAKISKSLYPSTPVVLLNSFSEKISQKIDRQDRSAIDYVFFWHGSADLIIAIIKLIEDRMNAEHDIIEAGVQAILLVEDSARYYSTYLPALYKLILEQTGEAVREALNEQQQVMRKRARPKILLATNLTDATATYYRYRENLLGVISDVGFLVNRTDREEDEKLDAGIELCKLIRADNPLMPFLLQSSQESIRDTARELGVGFLAKYSKTLLIQLEEYITSEFSFGDFIFREGRHIVGRAHTLGELQQLVGEVSAGVLMYSASQNHLSKWLLARGLFSLGEEFKSLRVEEFNSAEELRTSIVNRIRDYRIMTGQGIIARFDSESYNDSIWFARLGSGSMGGKARGLAFLNRMLQNYSLYDKYEGVRILLPRTIVITTDYFDRFILENGLQYVIDADTTDEEILAEFVASRLPQQLIDELHKFVSTIDRPLAVRSSSKLEDSYFQPFAGIYSTYMVPPTENEDQSVRLVSKAIKSVYASVFFASSRAYIASTGNVLSEERMAVVIQELCGSEDEGYYFPTFSGVARSENFYPLGDEKPEEGIVQVVFGLGKAVVDGEQSLQFSPRYPRRVLQTSTPELALRDTQKVMYALDLMPEKFKTSIDEGINLRRFEISEISRFRNLKYVASTFDRNSHRIVDTIEAAGPKVITFASILKYGTFPLAEIVGDLLKIASTEMSSGVEMEFAANLDVASGEPALFNVLQIRPIADEMRAVDIDWAKIEHSGALLTCDSAIGVGHIDGISDIVYVRSGAFSSTGTVTIASEVATVNALLKEQGRGYILVGYGRWGSSDPFLGIPVRWNDISGARIIVECGLQNFVVEPSQGTHFFQNLTSLGIGYMTVNPFRGDGSFDEANLDLMPAWWESDHLRCIRFDAPLTAIVDGLHNRGIIKS